VSGYGSYPRQDIINLLETDTSEYCSNTLRGEAANEDPRSPETILLRIPKATTRENWVATMVPARLPMYFTLKTSPVVSSVAVLNSDTGCKIMWKERTIDKAPDPNHREIGDHNEGFGDVKRELLAYVDGAAICEGLPGAGCCSWQTPHRQSRRGARLARPIDVHGRPGDPCQLPPSARGDSRYGIADAYEKEEECDTIPDLLGVEASSDFVWLREVRRSARHRDSGRTDWSKVARGQGVWM
jgi:hypothetical protein